MLIDFTLSRGPVIEGHGGTQVGCWSITIPGMKVRVRFIILDINRILFVSGVM